MFKLTISAPEDESCATPPLEQMDRILSSFAAAASGQRQEETAGVPSGLCFAEALWLSVNCAGG
jgi:hypothetical protein